MIAFLNVIYLLYRYLLLLESPASSPLALKFTLCDMHFQQFYCSFHHNKLMPSKALALFSALKTKAHGLNFEVQAV